MTKKNAASGKGITLEEAMAIAWETDPDADCVAESGNGYFFIRKEDMLSLSDPGFVVSKKDGEVYFGCEAHLFLQSAE